MIRYDKPIIKTAAEMKPGDIAFRCNVVTVSEIMATGASLCLKVATSTPAE